MKTLLRVAILLLLCPLVYGQATQVPICNGFDLSGNPINTGTNSTNCTDYFGSGNWANSPLPAGTITGYTLIAGGSGYTAPTVTVTDITGAALAGGAAPTPVLIGGVVTGFTGGTGGVGYTAPVITITDATGSGAMASAIIGPPFTGGIAKFKDPLVDLKTVIATPDPNVFAGSDYYEIALVQYTQSLSPANLPPTTLRGYVQVPTGSTGCAAASAATPRYMGPVILAQKGRPVRVKFTNCLAPGAGGNLFIPVDPTYMGAGMNQNGPSFTENRATLHLHGGATPWISDGTPHQWTTPAADAQKGDSVAYVPDMWFDVGGAVIPSCAGLATCSVLGASNNPGAGSLSFYWTNDQGARLMFYHDHAYGLTRLNVYAGEAAGYLLYDTAEEDALFAGTTPGTIGSSAATTDLGHLIPLVIQDKTFVPSKAQLDAQDPTWDSNFGATPLNSATANGNGDLWFPHVYMPNQNPNDPLGANGYGRWDYGAWFFPPQTSLTAAASVGSTNGITLSCTSKAFPGSTLASSSSCPSCGCPITPNPSGTPEGFMDTPVVNGVAYPVLHVAPAAYRFKILSAGNDRSLNLSWFMADATQGNTEVAMLPAAPPSTGSAVPLCAAINPVAVPSLVLGLATGLLDNAGNPLNGTGLLGGCWPNYGPQPGIPAPQTMWAADGRAGGAPDPRNAGPAWIQIGSEGGLLPAPVVIPPTTVNYEQNVRSITVGSVAVHGLWLGPAERADVVVDFSLFAGKTLILYNDAPTPAPAVDSRLDYFTNDGDQSAIGGAPNTPPGYGPNTRTIMQVVVDGTAPNTVPFSLPALKSAFASTATTQGVFAKTQPTTIVPEPAYNSAYNGSFSPNYASIQSTTFTFTPIGSQTLDYPCTPAATLPALCGTLDQKTIQELFTLDYGRMNATLGTELPNVNFQNQTTIPLGYIDPATEIIRQGNTQLWKITHNGVDTHFIHFHLFNVQVINRVGWDGSVRPIDANEAGWKDTVRMNPLEDILVALQPITPATQFPLANSVRLLDVTTAQGTTTATGGMFSDLNPYSNAGVTTVNDFQNFGWEYVWHCHILGHEESDMMRPIIFQVPPATPSNLVATASSSAVALTFTDNSASETGFTVQRSMNDSNFATPAAITTMMVPPSPALNKAGEGTDWGGTITVQDTLPDLVNTYFYRVQAVDDGWEGAMSQTYNRPVLGSNATCGLPPPAGTPVASGNCPLTSGWSNVVSPTAVQIAPTVTFTGAPATAVYNSTFIVAATTNASTMPAITATGVCTVSAVSGTATSALATVTITGGTGTCSLTANWAADQFFLAASATQSTTAAPATPLVSFTGAPASAAYGTGFIVTATTNAGIAPTLTATAACSIGAVSGTSPATASVSMTSGTGSCSLTANWAASTNYAAATAAQATTAALAVPTVTFTGAPASAAYSSTFGVTATTNAAITPVLAASGACSVSGASGTSPATATVTMTSGTGACGLTASWPATTNYAAATRTQSTAATKIASAIAISSHIPNPSLLGQTVSISFSATGTGLARPSGNATVTASTGESCTGALTNGVGSCTITFASYGSRTLTAAYAGDQNYNPSTSASLNHNVTDFSIGVSPASNTVNGNQNAQYRLVLTPIAGFVGTVSLSCSGYTGGPCTVSPSTVTLNGATVRANVTQSTTRNRRGTFTLTFRGTTAGGVLSHTTTATLTVR
jgi:FtsP/CotA-like multicopper oxidase with cupredoxin domain